ncbi:MAG TPA: glycosyltransferase family 39 protein [Candidatus Cybelea sp.]|nr:glycosyltransferase family 39 protein [Candidatus Cybelea sp.]
MTTTDWRTQGSARVPHDSRASARGDLAVLCAAAVAVMLVHVATNGRYGLHRDELQVLDDARHLAWGFVAYPPFTPSIERLGLLLFGRSMVGLRMFSVLAQGVVLVLAGLMARELGARRPAQIVSLLAVAVSPLPMFEATEFQYSSFDMLWWVLTAYFLIRLLKSENPRWWLGIGGAIGAGLMTKYTMAFYVAGIAGGVLLTPARRYWKHRWLWYGLALAFLLFLPNLIWQIRHDFVSLDFLKHIHTRDVAEGRAEGFLRGQLMINANPLLAPLCLAGVFYFFAARDAKPYRLLGWVYLLPLTIFFLAKGRMYYVGAAYPLLFAGGSVPWQRWGDRLSVLGSRLLEIATFAALAVGGTYAAALILPINPVISARNIALARNGDLREEIGWTDLAAEVATVRNQLTPAERTHFAILTGNYGETGAIDFYGPAYGLPQAISGTNTAWYRGYGDPPPQDLIVLGMSRQYVEGHFSSCRIAGHNGNPFGIRNEESGDHPDIFICGPPLAGWPGFWSDFRRFG